MNLIKPLVLFLLTISCLKLPKHYAEWTSGFRLSSCHIPLENRPEWGPSPPDPQTLSVLNQPFSLHRRGSQAYVFLSQDGQYVLKIFAKPLRDYVFPYRFHIRFLRKPQEPPQVLMEKGLRGYFLESRLPPQRTGLIYTHLNTTKKQLPTLPIQDAFGRSHNIPLDNYRFVIQKTCTPLTFALKESGKKDPEKLKHLIESYFQAISLRTSLGLKNCDTEFKKNFGVLDGQVIEFDCGEYALLPPGEEQKEREIFQDRICYWLDKHLPEYRQLAAQGSVIKQN